MVKYIRTTTYCLLIATIINSCIFISLCIHFYQSSKNIIDRHKIALELNDIRHKIRYYEEVLTQSSRMAVLTGDLEWKNRYLSFEPLLTREIQKAIQLAPKAYKLDISEKIEKANNYLVKSEIQSFQYLELGDLGNAKGMLFSQNYIQNKALYAKGLEKFDKEIEIEINNITKPLSDYTRFHITGLVVILPILIFTWLVTSKILINRESALQKSRDELIKNKAQLNELNSNLEAIIQKKTQLMLDTNIELKNEIDKHQISKEQLISSEIKFRSIFENTRDSFILCNSEKIIINVNPAFLKLIDKENIEKSHLVDVFEKDQYLKLEEYFEKEKNNENLNLLELNIHKNKTILTLEINVTEWYLKEEKFFALCLRDITERKSLENQIGHLNKMNSLAILASGIAHEVNNNLMVINGIVDLLQIDKDSQTLFIADLETIRKSSLKISKLITSLLTFSQRKSIELNEICLIEVIRKNKEVFAGSLNPKISIEYIIPNFSTYLMANIVALSTILKCLVSNSVEAIVENGEIIIGVSKELLLKEKLSEIGENIPVGEYLILEVTDNGSGIDNKIIKNIFEPFFTTKRFGESHGLSLANSFGLIKQMRGYIDVISKPGFTKFSIYFPRISSIKLKEDKRKGHNNSANEKLFNILCVDDEQIMVNFLKLALKELNFNIFTSVTATEAIEIYNKNKIDLIITDIVMPNLNGFDMVVQLKNEIKNNNTSVLFISSYANQFIIRERLIDINWKLLEKPFGLSQLKHAILRLFE